MHGVKCVLLGLVVKMCETHCSSQTEGASSGSSHFCASKPSPTLILELEMSFLIFCHLRIFSSNVISSTKPFLGLLSSPSSKAEASQGLECINFPIRTHYPTDQDSSSQRFSRFLPINLMVFWHSASFCVSSGQWEEGSPDQQLQHHLGTH